MQIYIDIVDYVNAMFAKHRTMLPYQAAIMTAG